MKVKTVVKVMNFHALLHIDSARRATEKYIRMESEVAKIIDIIMNNRNFILDKVALRVNEEAPPLNIYIGSDRSFCGGLNTQVTSRMLEDYDGEKITVGRKILTASENVPDVLLALSREEFDADFAQVEEILKNSIFYGKHSSINVIYNHYYHTGRIALRKRTIFPVPLASAPDGYTEDFVVDGDVDLLLRNLVSTYAGYEVKIASINSFAAENIMRQNATTESLKKIDEIMQEREKEERKAKKQKAFEKVLDSYMKKSVYGGNKE